MPRKGIQGLLVFAALAFQCASSSAETRFSLIPILQLSELYDDNLLLSPGRREADLVNQSLLGVYLSFDGARRSGSFQYDTAAQSYASHRAFDSFGDTHFVALSDQEYLSARTKASIDESFLLGSVGTGLMNGAAPWLNPQLAQAVLSAQRNRSNVLNLQFDHNATEYWSYSLALRQSLFSSPSGASYMQGAGVGALYRLSPGLSAGPTYDFTDFRFSDGGSPADAHFVQLRLEWNPGPCLRSNASGGLIVDQSGEIEPGYGVSARYDRELWHAQVAAGQAPDITAGLGGAGITRFTSGQVGYDLRRYTSVFAGASYYQLAGAEAGGQLIGYGGGVTHRIKNWLTIYAEYLGVRRTVDGVSPAVIPAGSTSLALGTAASNSYVIGATVSFEALRGGL